MKPSSTINFYCLEFEVVEQKQKIASLDISALSQKEVDMEIQRGLDDFEAGRIISAEQVRKRKKVR